MRWSRIVLAIALAQWPSPLKKAHWTFLPPSKLGVVMKRYEDGLAALWGYD